MNETDKATYCISDVADTLMVCEGAIDGVEAKVWMKEVGRRREVSFVGVYVSPSPLSFSNDGSL